MRTAHAAELLLAWERGLDQAPWQRALTLLAIGLPNVSATDLASLSIAERDARLLELREALFGPQLEGLAECPSCAQRVEFSTSTRSLHREPPHATDLDPLVVRNGDYAARCRLPNSLDLSAISLLSDPAQARRQLLERCLVRVETGGRALEAAELPAEAIDSINDQLDKADPWADLRFQLECPHCHHQWETPFDIGSFLWDEIHARALRLLREVHSLASAYSWSECDILALSPRRRRAYLDLVQA